MGLVLYTLVVVLLLFGATIFVHELGHFLAARSLGLVVETFSIGFGPAVWQKRVGGVLYKIGLLPFGGYVALPQIDHAAQSEKETKPKRHPPAPPWKKIIVSLAGAVGNVVLAFVLAWIIFRVGKPATPAELSATIGYVESNSPAYEAGVMIGDTIRAVNGEEVNNWPSYRILSALYEEVTLDIDRHGERFAVRLETAGGFAGINEVPGLAPVEECHVLSAMPGSSAEKAGLQRGDLILAFDGERIFSIPHLIDLVNRRPGEEARLLIRRDGRDMERTVKPAFDAEAGRALIGVQFNPHHVNPDLRVYPRPMAQVREHASRIFRVLRALVTPREARHASRALGGPPAILFSLWVMIQSSLVMALWFTGFLNVNLAIINLLPLPVLDGGHILFSLLEAIRRRPLNRRLFEALNYVFISLLVVLMLFLSWRDLTWLWPRGRDAGEKHDPAPAEEPARQPEKTGEPAGH